MFHVCPCKTFRSSSSWCWKQLLYEHTQCLKTTFTSYRWISLLFIEISRYRMGHWLISVRWCATRWLWLHINKQQFCCHTLVDTQLCRDIKLIWHHSHIQRVGQVNLHDTPVKLQKRFHCSHCPVIIHLECKVSMSSQKMSLCFGVVRMAMTNRKSCKTHEKTEVQTLCSPSCF